MEIKVNNATFPPQMEVTDDDGYTKIIEIGSFEEMSHQIIDDIEHDNVFNQIKLKKFMSVLKADAITFKENK